MLSSQRPSGFNVLNIDEPRPQTINVTVRWFIVLEDATVDRAHRVAFAEAASQSSMQKFSRRAFSTSRHVRDSVAINRHSRHVTQPKAQGASQVCLSRLSILLKC